jgi:8-oxo-dGTP diphosphatase
MDSLQETRDFLQKGYLEYRPGLSIDCAIFGYHEGELKLLLVKNKVVTKWCLPGGFVKRIENLAEAAARVTYERTGFGNLYLNQFRAYGNPGRNVSPGLLDEAKLQQLTGVIIEDDNWLLAETVSIGFYAITDIVNTQPNPDFISSECAWFSIDGLPELGFDHNQMVKDALFSMRIDLYHFPIGKTLLQPKFTLKEVKTLYEVLSGKKLNPTNFTNKLIALGIIEKLEEKKHIGAHRAPTYYKFREDVYEKALVEGLVLV